MIECNNIDQFILVIARLVEAGIAYEASAATLTIWTKGNTQ